ncbi:MAG TPA: hypothetical protein VFY90_10820, partial [Tepidiformaceae bacterium]|nr:hypothetical protein [Tepidiformaceae bacterium]
MSSSAGSPRLAETDDRYRSRLLEGLDITQVCRPVNRTETSILESGNGPALILLHGGIECGGVYWGPIVHEMARDYHV